MMISGVPIVLAGTLVMAGYFDVAERRIPNWLVLALLCSGVVVAMVTGGLKGAVVAVLLSGLGLLLWLPFHAMRMLGAGDVKLFAGASAWMASASQVLSAAAATAILGGLMALAWALYQRRVIAAVGNALTFIRYRVRAPMESTNQKLPYGVAMALGILWTFTRVWQ